MSEDKGFRRVSGAIEVGLPIGDGRQVRFAEGVALAPNGFADRLESLEQMEGDLEERTQAMHEMIDKEIGKGRSGHTSMSNILMMQRRYGPDAVQALIEAGRLGF